MPIEYIHENDASLPDPPDDDSCPLSQLTGFQRDLLFVIAGLEERHPNGITIKHALCESYGEEINQGRLYQNLRELFAEGFIEKRPLDGRENAYRVSPHAIELLDAHASWVSHGLRQTDGELNNDV